jgi:hypothetical protein
MTYGIYPSLSYAPGAEHLTEGFYNRVFEVAPTQHLNCD